jgi:hypothetical protein
MVSSITGDARGSEHLPSEQYESAIAAGGMRTERGTGGTLPFSFDMDYEDPLFGPIAGSSNSNTFKHHSTSDFSARSDMAPAWVEEILLNPLTAVQVAAANININSIGGLDSFGLGSWLETMGRTRPLGGGTGIGGVDGSKYRDFQAAQYENNPLCIVPAAIGAREIHAAVRKR